VDVLVPTEKFRMMHRLVDSDPRNLPVESWSDLYELTVAYEPDAVLELGRGWGNSTCVFTEAANVIGARVYSIGFDSEHAWETRTAPRLLPVVGPDWFAPLTVVQDDITTFDFGPFLTGNSRALVFWDAHGMEVADTVLNRLLPALPADNKVVVDDILPTPESYGRKAEYQAGPLWSHYEEVLPLWDYLSKRQIDFLPGVRWISFTARE
jgi:predicted O-methyltransferase YrrM